MRRVCKRVRWQRKSISRRWAHEYQAETNGREKIDGRQQGECEVDIEAGCFGQATFD